MSHPQDDFSWWPLIVLVGSFVSLAVVINVFDVHWGGAEANHFDSEAKEGICRYEGCERPAVREWTVSIRIGQGSSTEGGRTTHYYSDGSIRCALCEEHGAYAERGKWPPRDGSFAYVLAGLGALLLAFLTGGVLKIRKRIRGY